MRPRLLVAHAFGPFAGRLEIDFDRLSGAGLFLIYGPTGAGKTSILDAMCFALYGAVPGDRTVDGVRSHHAAPAAEASVELEFALHDIDWRVTRSPAQERTKKKGEGVTTTLAKATLARREGTEWHPVAGNVSEVGAEIRRLIGLDVEQFQQVVLLPQGEFERALRADAKQREALLSTLFATGRFGRYAEALGERSKAALDALDEHDHALESLRDAAIDAWREGMTDDTRDIPESPDIAALTAEVDQAAQLAEAEADWAEERTGSARAALAQAQQIVERTVRRNKLADRRLELVDLSGRISDAEEHLAAARRADPLLQLLEAVGRNRNNATFPSMA